MSTEQQFTISPSAERFLRGTVTVPGQEMGLVLAYGFEDKDVQGRVVDRYDGLHFYVAWNDPGSWSGERVRTAGRNLWISSDVAQAIRGKTLTVMRHESQDLLVAV
jgi:hypothetical protein